MGLNTCVACNKSSLYTGTISNETSIELSRIACDGQRSVSNEITKVVRSDNVEFRTGKTRPQPVPMSDISGLWQQVCKEAGLLDVITARQQQR